MDESVKMPKLGEDFPIPSLQEWRVSVEKLLAGKPFEKAMLTSTYEGITLQPMYTKSDVESIPHVAELPGYDSFVRGSLPLGYLQKPWEVSQEISYPDLDQCQAALKNDLTRGLTEIHLVCDDQIRHGTSADTCMSSKNGIPLHTLHDLRKILEGSECSNTSVTIQAGMSAVPVFAMLLAYWKEKSLGQMRGCIGMDPLGELVRTGKIPCSLKVAYDEMAMLTKAGLTHAPELRTVPVSGLPYHNAGADSASELAYLLATSVEYIFQLQNRGLTLEDILPRMQWNIAIGSNFFMEIAKLRAARHLWSQISEMLGAKMQSIYIHARGSSYNKTRYDVYVNMLRSTTEAFSAVLGGCQSLHVSYFDEAIRTPSELSRRIARNQQLILKEESHLDRVIDPAGGSWYLENLTHSVIQQAWKLFQNIASKGIVENLYSGEIQKKVEAIAQTRRDNFLTRKDIMVGINAFANMKDTLPTISCSCPNKLPVDEKVIAISLPVGQEIQGLMTAFQEGASIFQASQQLRPMAEPMQITPLRIHRLAEPYEQLRSTVLEYKQKENKSLQVFLLNMGSVDQHRARADFARNFFEIAGFEILDNTGFATPEDATKALLETSACIAVICSTDETYPILVPSLMTAIKEKCPHVLPILAGFPKEQVDAHKNSGIQEFIHIRANPYLVLSGLLKKMGVLEK